MLRQFLLFCNTLIILYIKESHLKLKKKNTSTNDLQIILSLNLLFFFILKFKENLIKYFYNILIMKFFYTSKIYLKSGLAYFLKSNYFLW